MPNPADLISEVDQVIEQSHGDVGLKSTIKLLETIANEVLIDAIVTGYGVEQEDKSKIGVYTVDLYQAGVPLEGQTDPKATALDIPAYPLMKEDDDILFEIGSPIRVKLLHDGVALIVPDILPRGTGFGKILTLLDSRKPSKAIWDHPRFW